MSTFEPSPFQLKPFPNGSSNLMGYDYYKGTLTIQFKYGKTYQYQIVPESVVDELLAAESHGKYFIAHIRDNKDYAFITVTT